MNGVLLRSARIGSDQTHQRRFSAVGFGCLLALTIAASVQAATLEPAAAKAWDQYVESASAQMKQRLVPGNVFLWVDQSPRRLARVRSGEIVVAPVGPENPKRLPSALLHHWIGAVFIPNVTLTDLLQVLRGYARYKDLYQPTVVDSKVIFSGAAEDRFSMLLAYKSLVLKAALATDNQSSYVRLDDHRAYSSSRTTRIREIEGYGTPAQRFLPEGQGSGVMWRLFSIARCAERDGGVYYEVEAIGLTRDIPPSLRWIADPMVRRISRASLSTSLRETEGAVRTLAASGALRAHASMTASN